MNREDPWDVSTGALIHHALELKKGVNIKSHLHRAKMRLIELDVLFKEDVPKEDLPPEVILLDACMMVYDKYPFSDDLIPLKKFAEKVNLITGKNAYPGSIAKKMREVRNGGHPPYEIYWECIGSHKKSLYRKQKPLEEKIPIKKSIEKSVQETLKF